MPTAATTPHSAGLSLDAGPALRLDEAEGGRLALRAPGGALDGEADRWSLRVREGRLAVRDHLEMAAGTFRVVGQKVALL